MVPDSVLSLCKPSTTFFRTVLVVEDEAMIRTVMTEFLQEDGYHVEEAADVAQAKQVLLRKSVDLVFSDINMPGAETGFCLERWVRHNFPRTKVLLTSGFPQVAADTKDLLVPLILKPYAYSTVIQHIQRLLPET